MADRYLLESGSPDGYLLEDSSGVLLLEAGTVQWSTSDQNAGVALSNSNLTATLSSTISSVRANVGGTGKFYFEVSVDAVGSTFGVGVADATGSLAAWSGDSGNTHGALQRNDTTQYSGGSSGVGFAYTTADIIGIAVDEPNKLVWWAKGNVWQLSGNPATGTNGVSISTASGAIYPIFQGAFSTEIATGRFTAASQTYSPPSGFTALDAGSGPPALTGQSLTSAIGSVLAATALALSGGALVGSQGSVAPQVSPALTSQSAAAACGSVSPNVTVALTGQSLSAAQGTVVGGSVVTGQSTTVAQGSVTQSVSVALTGQSLTASRGSLVPTNTEALSGQSLSAAQGTLTPGIAEALTGQALVAARGSVTQSSSVGLSGQSAAVARGTVIPTFALGLSGGSLVVSGGTVTASVASAGTVALTGQSLGTAIGSVVATISPALTGQALSLTGGSLVPAYELVLSGQGLTGSQGTIVGGEVLPTQPFVPPTITFGFRRKQPTQSTWGPGSSSGAAWTEENETQSNWAAGGNSSGANWEKS